MAKTDLSKKTINGGSEQFVEPKDFESAFSELESILGTMESGQLSLAQALSAYKRGDTLLQYCQKTLESAEQEVRILNENNALVPFDSDQ